jgi:hypothetical protein
MPLPYQPIGRQLTHTIRPEGCSLALLHVRNCTDGRSYVDEFPVPPLLQQRLGALEQEEDGVRVDHHVGLQRGQGHGACRAEVCGYGGVGDDDVEVGDAVGGGEAADGEAGGGGG